MSLLDINVVLLSYVIPLITSYLFAKLYFTYVPAYMDERPGFLTIFAILCPAVNIIFTLIWAVCGLTEYHEAQKRLGRGKPIRTIGEAFLRMNKEKKK